MIISGKIAKLFKFPGFVNIDYLVEQKIYVSPSMILNALTRDWRKWRRPVGFDKDQKVKAAYPATIDPTFGYETAGGSSQSVANRISGSWFTCPESGTADSISLAAAGTVSRVHSKCAIYKKSDNSLVGVTDEKEGVSSGWNTYSFSTSPSLSNIDYYLVAWSDAYFGQGVDLRYDTASGKGGYEARTYNGFPDPWSPTSEDRIYSIYCTYTTVPAAGFRKLQYYSEPPSAGWNKLKFASEPPVAGAWNKLLYEGE